MLFDNVPSIYFSNILTEPAYMVSHSLTPLSKDMISGDLPKIKQEAGISCEVLLQYAVLCCFVSVDDKGESIENLIVYQAPLFPVAMSLFSSIQNAVVSTHFVI